MACDFDKPEFLCLPPETPPAGHIYAPYVELIIRDMIFTCGNESYPLDPNKLAIKSMQYGVAQGQGGFKCEFELIAEGSKGYREIVDRLNKAIGEASTEIRDSMFRFGWLRKLCGQETPFASPISPWIYCLPIKLTSNIDSGVAKLKLECTDLMYRSFSRRVQGNQGTDDNLIELKDAIRNLCAANDPVINVEFRNFDGTGEIEFKNSQDEEGNGPGGVWQGNELPLLATIRNWVNSTATVNEKGVYFAYDPEFMTLILQEDPECRSGENCDECLVKASYIVNGGNCSPVISFQPTIEWTLDAGGGGGGSGGSTSGRMLTAEPLEQEEPIENSGSGNQTSINSDARSIPPEVAAINAKEAAAAHTVANKPFDLRQTIEAELTIIGDPSWYKLTELIARYVSIAVLSPFSIGGEKPECIWIADPPINEVLTNKKWFVKGVDHQIESGKFVTKLKVALPAGNAELPVGSPLGSGGYNPEGQGDGNFEGQT